MMKEEMTYKSVPAPSRLIRMGATYAEIRTVMTVGSISEKDRVPEKRYEVRPSLKAGTKRD
jgi:hypothetical protein